MSKLVTAVIAILMAAMSLGPVAEAHAQASPVPDDGRYRDREGRFTVPVPTGWTVEEQAGFTTLRDPDGDLAVHLLLVSAETVAEGVTEALTRIHAPIDDEPPMPTIQEFPSRPGVDESVIFTYVADDQQSFVQVVGQRIGTAVYFMVFSGTIEAAAARNSQIQIIAGGFTITSLSEVDLADRQPRPLSRSLLSELEQYVNELMTRLEMPGASIAIVADGKVVYAQGFGVKEIGGTEPVTPDTQMMIGSTTKSMTTLMMATEVDDGLMTWDQPVVEILPEFVVADPELTKTVTVRNLVCACTGVPRRDFEFMFNASEMTAEDVIASLEGFRFITGFGEVFQYSNQMVAAGGYVAAAAAGGEYGDLFDAYSQQMQARVFDPIGLADTTLSFDAVQTRDDYAAPHGATLEGTYEPVPLSLEQTLVPVAPAGLVWSTASDMARYLITELQRGIGPDGNRVVSAGNLEETWVPQVAVDASTSYGLGWLIEDYHGLRVIHHGGNTLGFTSGLAFLPDQGIGIVVLANGQSANALTDGVRYRLLELLYDLPVEFDEQIDYAMKQSEEAYRAAMDQISGVPRGIMDMAAGTYENDALGPIELSVEDGELVLDAGEFRTELKFADGSGEEGETVLVAADPPLPGTPFVMTVHPDGSREITLKFGTDTYVFEQRGGTATPAAGDEATPIAA